MHTTDSVLAEINSLVRPAMSVPPNHPNGDIHRPQSAASMGHNAADKMTMLVVDDEEGPRQSLRMVFRRELNVVTVDSGAAAIEFLRDHETHIAVLDIRMADCNGIDVLRRIKEIDPRVEVIMLTAYETLETARQALRLGACDYLSKPFDLGTIREAVTRALHLRTISENIASASERLRELTNRLGDAQLREEVARTRNEIYAGVLHDISNPLTVICGYIDVLQERLKSASTIGPATLDQVRHDLDIISKQANTCGAIAARYLRFIKQRDSGHTVVSVNQALEDLQTLLQHHRSSKANHLEVTPLQPDQVLDVDATDLIQILINLGVNAFQSTTRRQTVRIYATHLDGVPTIEDEELTYTVGAESFNPDGPVTAITVCDEGDGIPAEQFDRIFEPYFTTKAAHGTGLGLSIVSRLVKSNRGLLTIRSTPATGTSISVHFASGPLN